MEKKSLGLGQFLFFILRFSFFIFNLKGDILASPFSYYGCLNINP